MSGRSRASRLAEGLAWSLGILFLSWSVLAETHREVYQWRGQREVEHAVESPALPVTAVPLATGQNLGRRRLVMRFASISR